MYRGYSVQAIQGLPELASTEQMERIMESGFSSLTSLVLAEATGAAPLAARDVLNRRSNCEMWVWTLTHVRANLSHSMALRCIQVGREGLIDDPQYRALAAKRRQVTARLAEARKRVRAVRYTMDQEMLGQVPDSAPDGATRALIEAEPAEFRRALADAKRAPGAAEEVFSPPEGADRDPLWAAGHKLIREPVTEAAREALEVNDEEFADRVGDDTREPGGLHSALRHALVLPRWGQELERLTLITRARLGLSEDVPANLPDEMWLDMPEDEVYARKRAGRMRFVEALQTRLVEQEALLDAVGRQIRFGIERKRVSVERSAHELLRERLPHEYALYNALTA